LFLREKCYKIYKGHGISKYQFCSKPELIRL
jgi:hypothetical protein